MPAAPSARRPLVAGLVALLAAVALLAVRPAPAAAAVTHLHGFRATVDGFTSWYGSYGMAGLGPAWCIDHGSHAPDPAFAYAPADLRAVPPDVQAAMAWLLGTSAGTADRVEHAAVMLALHDLMGARYPSGRLDVDRLSPAQLAGFAGQEARVLARARALKADGLAHRHLRGPLRLDVEVPLPTQGETTVTVRVRDGRGHPVPGVAVRVDGRAAELAAPGGTTGADGTWRTQAQVAPPATVRAAATVPRLVIDAWAPTTRPAQRVARPAVDELRAEVTLAAPPTTTTTTTTTTTVPPTTTTTIVSPTTTTTTTAPPTTVAVVAPPTTAPAPSSTTTTVPPAPAPVPVRATLPRTGVDTAALCLAAVGLLLLGWAALATARDGGRRPPAIGHHGGHGQVGR